MRLKHLLGDSRFIFTRYGFATTLCTCAGPVYPGLTRYMSDPGSHTALVLTKAPT